MTRKELEDALIAMISSATGVLTYLEHPNAPTPDEYPYATINVGGARPYGGIPWQQNRLLPNGGPGADLEVIHTEPVRWNVTVHVYSAEPNGNGCAVAIADTARRQMSLTSVYKCLSDVGSTLRNRGEVVDVGEAVEGGWRGHAQFDLEILGVVSASEVTTWIERTRTPLITLNPDGTVSGET